MACSLIVMPRSCSKIHIVKHLVDDKVALRDRAGEFQQPIRKRGFAVVDVRDDAEVSKLVH